jgi:hypothetical protein
MDGSSVEADKEMMRGSNLLRIRVIMKLLEDTEKWVLLSCCDSDWSGDADTSISLTDFARCDYLFLPKGQKGGIHSSSNAEYVSISEAVKFV